MAKRAASAQSPVQDSLSDQDLLALLRRGLADGTVQIQVAPSAAAMLDRPTAVHKPPIEISRALQKLLGDIHEPKRQRKVRDMPLRAAYHTLAIRDPKTFEALRHLTPAAVAIWSFIEAHQGTTVVEIAAGLDLRKKTVQNLLSVLKRAKLIESKTRH